MLYKRTLLSVVLGLILVLAMALVVGAQTVTPSVSVSDQAVQDGMVMIDEVVAAQDGWLVIHAQKDGGIGPVIGYAAVTAGSNTYLMVEIDPMGATETLYAMLHIDEGVKGTYEFPGADGPAKVDGKPVTPPFMVTNYAAMSAAMQPAAAPEMLPVTGGVVAEESLASTSWVLPVVLFLVVLGAAGIYSRQSRKTNS